MSKDIRFRRSTAILTLVAASLGGGIVAALMVSSRAGAPAQVTAEAAGYGPANVASYADMLEKVTPAVVSVKSTRIVKAQDNPMFSDPFFQQFFGRQFGQQAPRSHKEGGLGSGVIINQDGYILTNNHVVQGAKELDVQLLDRRSFKAKVVGTDEQTDIAVLKIDAKDLPTVHFGDSAKARIGDICFAIGNPFGVGQTVTSGIVSAKSRSMRGSIEGFEDFIQTDAAINPGNSGGALIDSNGRLIGINTAILAGNSGGNQGIGFAIPVNLARNVMDQIIKSGKVTRGYMGAYLQDVTPDLAQQFGAKDVNGAIVTKIEKGKPADQAGLKIGDVVTGINGNSVSQANDLVISIIQMNPGSVVHLDVLRNGKPLKIDVTLGARPAEKQEDSDFSSGGGSGSASTALGGVSVETLTSDIAGQLNLPVGTKGVVVDSVDEDSPAAEVLTRGDVIEQVNRVPVANQQDYDRLVRQAKGESILLLINRKGGNQFVVVPSK